MKLWNVSAVAFAIGLMSPLAHAGDPCEALVAEAVLSDVSKPWVSATQSLLKIYTVLSTVPDPAKAAAELSPWWTPRGDWTTLSGRALMGILTKPTSERLGPSDTAVLSFRGSKASTSTQTLRNMLIDAKAILSAPKFFTATSGEKVHAGFQSEYLKFRERVLAGAKAHEQAGGAKLIVHGHSLGGALATLAAVDIALNTKLRVTLITTAAPRVGNAAFRKTLEGKVPLSGRVVLDSDPIPDLPANRSFEHAGFFVLLSSKGIRISDDLISTNKRVHGSVSKDFSSHAFEKYAEALGEFFDASCASSAPACGASGWTSSAAERTWRNK